MVCGYGGSPGSAWKTGPISSSVPSNPQLVSPKCTSFAVANVASRRPAGQARVVTSAGSSGDGSVPSTCSA